MKTSTTENNNTAKANSATPPNKSAVTNAGPENQEPLQDEEDAGDNGGSLIEAPGEEIDDLDNDQLDVDEESNNTEHEHDTVNPSSGTAQTSRSGGL